MSKADGFMVLATDTAAADIAVKVAGPNPQNVAKQKFTDISNLPPKMIPLIQEDKSQSLPTTVKSYIEQLRKENTALVKMLEQRNKIIEQSGIELERLRSNLFKVQRQNQQLALSHTQMMRELNFGKDRLKTLQHELGCKNGLLKARKLGGGEHCEVPHQNADEVDLIKLPEEGETSTVSGDDDLPRNTKRRLRSLSCGSSETLQSEENAGHRRPPLRRQSVRFKAVKSKSVEDSSEKNETNPRSTSENLIMLPEGAVASTAGRYDEKPTKRMRSQSFSYSEPLQSKANAENKRTAAKRQHSRFKVALESSSGEDLSQKCNIKFPKPSQQKYRPTSGITAVKDEDNRLSSDLKYESPENRRPSLYRPSRLAAKRVQSYKEVPLNVKMRRPE